MAVGKPATRFMPVLGFDDYRVGDDGTVWSKKSGTWKKLKLHSYGRYGHLKVNLFRDDVLHQRTVHRLVLEAFVGPCPVGMECRHFPDRDPSNNNLTNLSWSSHQTNMDDRVLHATVPRGEDHHGARLTVKKVLEIRKMYASGDYSYHALATIFKVATTNIRRIVKRETWKHV